jgi:hypothetical protein
MFEVLPPLETKKPMARTRGNARDLLQSICKQFLPFG